MLFQNPSFILVRPQLPENIGMTARALDNCSFKNLTLVSPKKKWPNEKAVKAAANSSNFLEQTLVYNSLSEAISPFNFVVGTSSRKRFLQKPVYNNFNKIFEIISKYKKIAFLFGPENSGLSNQDLMLCDVIFNIDLSKKNKSLNLSHAVLLIAYKFREFFSSKNSKNDNIKINIAKKKDFSFFMEFLRQQLDEVGFLHPEDKKEKMFQNIQTMFLRSSLSKKEIDTLWGMIKKLRNITKKSIIRN